MRYVMSIVGAISLVVGMATMALGQGAVAAAPVTISGVATGAEENPPVAGAGTVSVRFTFDDATKVLTYNAQISGISASEVTASHIHRGAKGVNGPIVHNLSTTSFSTIGGSITLSDADVADLKAGNFYFNAHSVANPGGFARLQLILPASAPAPSSTAAPAPPRTGDGGLIVENSNSIALPLAIFGIIMLTSAGGLTLVRRRF